MRYLIIGLGIYGENLARDLTAMGHEVIGADSDASHVEALKEYISTVYVIDSTEEAQLSVLPLLNVDLVVVAIGENFGASIKTVALLKKAGVKHIYARAIDSLHEAILRSFEIDRILTPEQRAASDLTHELALGSEVRTLAVGTDALVIDMAVPEAYHGMSYDDISRRLATDFDITLVAVCRPKERTNVLGIKRPALELLADRAALAEPSDRITLCARRTRIHDLLRHLV